MSRLIIHDLPLSGLKLIERKRLGDSRGFLSRVFCADELALCGWQKPIAQINHTYTAKKGTIRGMHYQQLPHSEMKLVSCLQGVILDVAIDLRVNSPTFLQWHAQKLSDSNDCALLIPEGFAHGFQTLSDDVQLLYCHSNRFEPTAEQGVNVLDPRIDIDWPLPAIALSARDKSFSFLEPNFKGMSIK